MNRIFYLNLQIGTLLFGRYQIESVLAAGEHSGVYRCYVLSGAHAGQMAAVKITHRDGDGELVGFRLSKESHILKRVAHPNVMSIFEWLEDPVFCAYAMEYLPRGTLQEELDTRRYGFTPRTLSILLQTLLGLQAIHRQSIVHRDLKPSNILLASNGTIKIADFGLAEPFRYALGELNSDLVFGTLDYLPPETIRSGTFDIRSDLYAWGIIAYEMLSGFRPHYEDNGALENFLYQKASIPVRSLIASGLNIPEAMDALILKALDINPDKRFESTEELIASFMPMLESLSTTPVSPREFQRRPLVESRSIRFPRQRPEKLPLLKRRIS